MTKEMLLSDEPCAMAIRFTPSRPSALKVLPAIPQSLGHPRLLALHLEWRLEPSRRHRCFAPSALSLCRVALARSCYGSTPGSPPAPRDSVFSDAGPSRQSTRALPPRGRKPPE